MAKAILRNVELEGTGLISDYATKLQLSRRYGTGTKADVSLDGTRGQAQRLTHPSVVTQSLTKQARIYNGEKTASSISGAGRTGQLHVKECNS